MCTYSRNGLINTICRAISSSHFYLLFTSSYLQRSCLPFWAAVCRSNCYQLWKQSCFRVTACEAVVSHNEHFLYSYTDLYLSVFKRGLLRQCVDQSATPTRSVSLLNISSVFALTANLASSEFIFAQIIEKCVEWFWTDEVLAELPEMLQLRWQFHIYISFWEATANAFFLCASGLMFCF